MPNNQSAEQEKLRLLSAKYMPEEMEKVRKFVKRTSLTRVEKSLALKRAWERARGNDPNKKYPISADGIKKHAERMKPEFKKRDEAAERRRERKKKKKEAEKLKAKKLKEKEKKAKKAKK